MRLFARVEYDGGSFAGWQYQPHQLSVQEAIEKAVLQVTQETVRVIGSGRTDAGVHGRGQGIHMDIQREWHLPSLCRGINALLPQTVALYDMVEVSSNFHARFSAKERVYKYYLVDRKSPLMQQRAMVVTYPINWELFEENLHALKGTHCFSSLVAAHGSTENHVCTINEASLQIVAPGVRVVTISANRFLYKMIRNTIGSLIDISRGKLQYSMVELLSLSHRSYAGPTAPPCGLVLDWVYYDEVA